MMLVVQDSVLIITSNRYKLNIVMVGFVNYKLILRQLTVAIVTYSKIKCINAL